MLIGDPMRVDDSTTKANEGFQRGILKKPNTYKKVKNDSRKKQEKNKLNRINDNLL